MTISSVNVARYKYVGFGNVVGVDYDEADVYQHRYGTTTGSYPDLDQFGRVVKSRWTKDLSTDMDFVSVDVGYDENSNPLTTEENIYSAGFDVKYAIDGMDRVTDADEGTLISGSIDVPTRQRRQQWTLTQTGNWDNEKLDLNGDGDQADAGEHNDTRTHNAVNELTARDTNSDSTNDYSLTYDAAGNLTDDGETYAYVYDAWYRLRKIKDRGTSAVLSEHQYYGNGFRAGEHYDANEDSTVDGTDPWYWFAYDERWRIVGTFVGSDSSPKERFLHHTAGAGGYGMSSYIDQVVLRERDANTNWHASSDGTLEERLYYCQNWRHDVVALLTSAGALKERVRYSSYGVPFGIPLGDCDSDGDVDSADQSILNAAVGTSSPKCDLDLSGTIDATDQSAQVGNSGATGGIGQLTRNRNRFGYAGYCADARAFPPSLVRWRALGHGLGRWLTRDPLSRVRVDLANLYETAPSLSERSNDPSGLSPEIQEPPNPGDGQFRFNPFGPTQDPNNPYFQTTSCVGAICAIPFSAVGGVPGGFTFTTETTTCTAPAGVGAYAKAKCEMNGKAESGVLVPGPVAVGSCAQNAMSALAAASACAWGCECRGDGTFTASWAPCTATQEASWTCGSPPAPMISCTTKATFTGGANISFEQGTCVKIFGGLSPDVPPARWPGVPPPYVFPAPPSPTSLPPFLLPPL